MSSLTYLRGHCVVVVPVIVLALLAGESRGQGKSEKKYPFAHPPIEILDRLGMAGIDKPVPIPEADRALLVELWAARSAKKALPPADDRAVTAYLIASGVAEPAARAGYLKKFDALVAAAEKAVAGTKTDAEKADQLLRFLHKEVMKKGYEENQTTLSAVFDTGKYNCVSSACLYYLVGTRLGLKLQPVLIPGTPYSAGHAAVDLLDGSKRVELEPTNPDGYDWPAKLKQQGVIVIGAQPDRKKAYDTDGFGLAGSIASNRGVAAAKAKPSRPVESIREGLIALVLDPTDDTATENLLASVSNWGLAFDKEKRFEDALKVYAFGRAALGANKKLEHNHKVVWEHYLDAAFSGERVADGLKLLPRAAAAFPDQKDFSNPAEWVSRAATRKAKADGWGKGLSFADVALKDLKGKDADAVRGEWKDHSAELVQDLLGKGDADGSLKVIADGLNSDAENKELIDGLEYHTQEALRHLDSKKGTAAASAHFQAIVKAFPKSQGVREMGYNHAAKAVDKISSAKKFAEALKAAAAYESIAGDKAANVACHVYDDWARSLAKDGKWEDAIKKYAEGLAAHPKNTLLLKNGPIAVDQWGVKAINEKKWAVAIQRYELGIKHLGDHEDLRKRIEYCRKKMER